MGNSLTSALCGKTRLYPHHGNIVLSFFKDSGVPPDPHRRQNPALRLDDVMYM